jgi:GR25 family glycosyltransferase involved in LPS biosynthesis
MSDTDFETNSQDTIFAEEEFKSPVLDKITIKDRYNPEYAVEENNARSINYLSNIFDNILTTEITKSENERIIQIFLQMDELILQLCKIFALNINKNLKTFKGFLINLQMDYITLPEIIKTIKEDDVNFEKNFEKFYNTALTEFNTKQLLGEEFIPLKNFELLKSMLGKVYPIVQFNEPEFKKNVKQKVQSIMALMMETKPKKNSIYKNNIGQVVHFFYNLMILNFFYLGKNFTDYKIFSKYMEKKYNYIDQTKYSSEKYFNNIIQNYNKFFPTDENFLQALHYMFNKFVDYKNSTRSK